MEAARASAIRQPFPNGESYEQVAVRMHSFLQKLASGDDAQRVMLIGHGATLWMLERWLRKRPLEEVVGVMPERAWIFRLDPKEWDT